MARGWEGHAPISDARALEMACSQGHRPSMLVRTSYGGAFCLACFTDLITTPSSLVVHRAQALSEISEALTDPEFCGALMQKHPGFLAAPLAEAIFFTGDEDLAIAIIDVLITTCKLALENGDDALLQDVMLQMCSHLSSSEIAPWKHGHLFSLHGLGLVLELHCHHDNHIPEAIKSQPGCVHNFVSALKLPSDEMRVDIFFILVKLTSLEGGIELLVEYCPSLVYLAIRALEKTQSDEVRAKSLDLLIALAQASVFNISLPPAPFPGKCDTRDSQETALPSETSASFVEQFAEAMKASLLSSDTQVQIRSLELIGQVCPTSLDISEELHSLINEGITDYIFEVLRVSGDLDAVAAIAIQTLETLSLAFPTFSHHFGLGLEPLLRVLEHSFTSAFGTLQKDTLLVIAGGIADRPGVVSATLAERLLNLLKKSFRQYTSVIKDHAISDILGFGLSPEGLNATCGTLTTLLRAPSCSNISSICPMLQDCVCALTDCISADPIYASQHNGLRFAAYLVQEAYLFSVHQNFAYQQFTDLTEFLMAHFHLRMLPVFTANWENISDEETINTFFSAVENIVQVGDAIKTGAFARILISEYWVSMAFESMSRFPSEDLKRNVYSVISRMIDGISSCGELIQDVIPHLPTDVEGLLVLLEQRSNEDLHLIATHQTIIALIFTTFEHGDRLVESNQLLSSLEQHLLENTSSSLLASPTSPTLKQFFLLYVDGQENQISQGLFCSIKAENIMLDILQAAYNTGSSFTYELPMFALKWIMQKERLFPIAMDLLLKNLDAGTEVHAAIAQLVMQEDECVTQVIISMFVHIVGRHLEDDIRILAIGLSGIIRQNWNCAKKFHSHGVVSTLRRFMLLQGAKAPEATVTSCVELLFQLLVFLDEEMAEMDEGAWLDIASQAEKLLLSQLGKGSIIKTSSVPLVNLIALIMHKSMRAPTLLDAARKVYMSNELRDVFERNIVNASQMGSSLTTMDINSEDGVTLSASLLFHVLWLRCLYSGTIRSKVIHEGMDVSIEGLLTSSKDFNEKILASSTISFQHLCQLLCFSTHPLQSLTSSCLVELLSNVTNSGALYMTCNDKLQENLADCSVNHLKSVTLILQGAVLGSDGLLRKNACVCMMRLLATTCLDLKQKEAIARSPWYKTVAEELLLSLPQAQVNVTAKEGIHYSASILSAILRVSPPYEWLPSVFNPWALAAVVESFKTTQNVTVGTVEFFLELLKGGFLDHERVDMLRNLYQAVRRKCYRERFMTLHTRGTLSPGEDSQSFMGIISNLEGRIEYMGSGSIIMHLAHYDTEDPLERWFRKAHTSELNTESLLLVKIDEFLQTSA